MSEKLYIQLEELALPVIEGYNADRTSLTKCDRNFILENPGVPFLHFTGNVGTYLIPLMPAEHPSWPADGEIVPYMFGRADRWKILQGKLDLAKYLALQADYHRKRLALHCDGSRLRKISLEKAHEIAKQYVQRVKSAWNLQLAERYFEELHENP